MDQHPREKLLQNTTQLSVWLERCAKAGIPAVPAIFSPEILVEEIFSALDGKGGPATLTRAEKWLEQNLEPGTMWRWEQCAPLHLKSAMASKGTASQLIPFTIDDPRLVDILFENNVRTTRLAVRPVIEIQRQHGYPIEFRCYVFGPQEVAVSNYYAQMHLPESFRQTAQQAGALAVQLQPHVGTGFTADFCLAPNGHLIFLEGGPPWGQGSRPCCFDPDKLKPGRIVLGPEEGALTR